jgi:hypothetical protein
MFVQLYNKQMKTTIKFRYLFTIFFALLFITSCNIEPFEGEIPEGEIAEGDDDVSGVFQVDFDSQTYVADVVTASVSDGIINISGLKGDNQELITLTVFASTVGTYNIGISDGIEVNGAAYNTNSKDGSGDTWIGATNFLDSQGQITITEIDNEGETISGTFFFTGHNPDLGIKEFTNGVFEKVSFAVVSSGSGENSFFAKVDGVEFVEEKINAISVSAGGISNLGISATIGSSRVLGLNLDPNVTPGEYELSTFGIPSGLYSKSFSESFSSDSGKVVITLHDKANRRIVGTFEFTAKSFLSPDESYEITEGSFDVTYF